MDEALLPRRYTAAMRPVSILFICIGNTCRSPMAEAIARALGGDSLVAHSAGIAPTGRVASSTLEALRALGYPCAGLASKGLDEVPLDGLDVVVSLIGPAGLAWLPAGVAARRVAWTIPDPYGNDIATYLAVARTIEERVRALVDDLLPPELPAR
ncbi:MAG: low molecular weight phosphatase family protein [Holophagae bacterium]|nr:MAG: low molecular weight phosphatase family protein [Holophagae bacterium]